MSHTQQNKPVIALDSGKVLIDFDYAILTQRLSRLAGFEIDPEMVSRMEELNSLMQIGQLTWAQAIKILNRSLRISVSEKEWIDLYNGVLTHEIVRMREVLSDLKKTYRLVVLSNTDEIHWSYLLKTFPIYALLDGWVVSHQEKVVKPGPAIYQIFMKRYCNNGFPAFFTDDMPENVETARKLGWRAEIFVDAEHFIEHIKSIPS